MTTCPYCNTLLGEAKNSEEDMNLLSAHFYFNECAVSINYNPTRDTLELKHRAKEWRDKTPYARSDFNSQLDTKKRNQD